MRNWIGEIDGLLGELDKNLRGIARTVRSVLDDGPHGIFTYRGYGTAQSAYVHGRAVERRKAGASGEHDSTLANLVNTYRRVDSDPISLAQVAVQYADRSTLMKADDEGFFEGRIDLTAPVPDGGEWRKYEVEIISPARAGRDPAKADGEILVPPPGTRFGVISDIDDTVIQSRVSNFLLAARTVILGNARTRLPFPGVAGFYQALRDGAGGDEKNPIFYVSSSPWNIYDVIAEFMDLQKIPRGPILLRDWDIGLTSLASGRHFEHKGAAIRRIMQLYPALPFILIGDTSQHDPEIYRQIVAEFPERIRAIYIRDVTRNEERSTSVKKLAEEILAAKSTLVLSEDTLGAAKHAVEQGWIKEDALANVREEKHADEGRNDTKASTPDGGKPSSGAAPTVIE